MGGPLSDSTRDTLLALERYSFSSLHLRQAEKRASTLGMWGVAICMNICWRKEAPTSAYHPGVMSLNIPVGRLRGSCMLMRMVRTRVLKTFVKKTRKDTLTSKSTCVWCPSNSERKRMEEPNTPLTTTTTTDLMI